jgi:hypothetical protein
VAEKRFPYEQSSWSDDAEQKRRWYEALERMGLAHARARLTEINAGSRAGYIGMEVGITKGFVDEWLAWHDRQERERERSFRRFWTRWTAVAIALTAIAATGSFALTAWRKW